MIGKYRGMNVKQWVIAGLWFIGSFFIAYGVYAQPQHRVYVELHGEMTVASVQPVVRALLSANSNDVVIIDIDSPGGDLRALRNILTAYNVSKAGDVIAVVKQEADSAAAYLTVLIAHRVVDAEAILMFHLPSTCISEPPPSTTKRCYRLTNPNSFWDKLAYHLALQVLDKAVKLHILTDNEANKVLRGGDVFVLGTSGLEINAATGEPVQ